MDSRVWRAVPHTLRPLVNWDFSQRPLAPRLVRHVSASTHLTLELTCAFLRSCSLGLTWLLWTASAAAVTEMLGGGLNCKFQDFFVYCNQLNALEAFAWIEW